jgi:hypothetical protein
MEYVMDIHEGLDEDIFSQAITLLGVLHTPEK